MLVFMAVKYQKVLALSFEHMLYITLFIVIIIQVDMGVLLYSLHVQFGVPWIIKRKVTQSLRILFFYLISSIVVLCKYFITTSPGGKGNDLSLYRSSDF